MAGGDTGSKSTKSEPNVVPLCDILLVLLIIFMVTAPMMIEGIRVNLPKVKAKYITRKQEPLIVTITKEKKIYIQRYVMDLEELDYKLRKIFKNRRDVQLLIKADRSVPYGFFVKVISKIKKAGISRIGLITEPEIR